MDVPKPPPKTPWILLGVVVALAVVGLVTITLAAALYLSVCGSALTSKKAAVNSPLSEKPRLPDDSRQLAEEAAAQFSSGNYDNAAADYQRIIDHHPDSVFAWSNLGVIRFTAGDLDRAKAALEKCVAMAPKDAFSRTYLGMTYYRLARYDDALAMLEKAVALDPSYAMGHTFLGCCLSQKGNPVDAIREFKKAIELDSHSHDAYFNLAVVLATTKPPDIVQARFNYKRAIELGATRDPKLEKLLATDTSTP
jgi:tetratricopeptide (TPR) repeat protein